MNRKLFCLLFGVVSFFHARAQVITTIAGNGTAGYGGDGGPATAAELTRPSDVKVDGLGSVFIADAINGVIRKVSTSGIISTVAGNGTPGFDGDGGPASVAMLSGNFFMTVDGSGNLYISDSYNNRIRKVNASGIITTIAGNGAAGYSGDGGPATDAELNLPNDLAVDGLGNLYIADPGNNRVRKISVSGIITTIAGNGTAGYSGDGLPATAAGLFKPGSVAVDALGNVYVADNENNRIRKVNTSGIISTIAGNGISGYSGDGMPATDAALYLGDIAIDGSGNLYVSDNAHNCVRKVNTSGIISTIAGNSIAGYSGDGISATAAELYSPAGLTVDDLGNVFIADLANFRIRKVNISPTYEPNLDNGLIAINVYPNPNAGQFTLNVSSPINEQAHITIINLLGQKVKELDAGTNKPIEIALNVAPGLYFLTATTAQGKWNEQLVIAP